MGEAQGNEIGSGFVSLRLGCLNLDRGADAGTTTGAGVGVGGGQMGDIRGVGALVQPYSGRLHWIVAGWCPAS